MLHQGKPQKGQELPLFVSQNRSKGGSTKIINKLRNNRGISIIELLVACSLLVIVLGVGYNFYYYANQTFNFGLEQANLQNDTRIAVETISNELRYAENISDSAFASEITTYKHLYRDSDNTIKIDSYEKGVPTTISLRGNTINNLKFSLEKEETTRGCMLTFDLNYADLESPNKYAVFLVNYRGNAIFTMKNNIYYMGSI